MTRAEPCFILAPLIDPSQLSIPPVYLCFGLSPQMSCLCFTPLPQKAVTIPNKDPAFPSWFSGGVTSPQGSSFFDSTLGPFTPLALSSGGIGLLVNEITQTMAATWVDRRILRQTLSECGELIAYIFSPPWT